MGRDTDTKTDRLLDKRTVERNIKKGLLSRKDYDKHLKALADVAEKGLVGGPEVDDDDDDDLPEDALETEAETEAEGDAPAEGDAGAEQP